MPLPARASLKKEKRTENGKTDTVLKIVMKKLIQKCLFLSTFKCQNLLQKFITYEQAALTFCFISNFYLNEIANELKNLIEVWHQTEK